MCSLLRVLISIALFLTSSLALPPVILDTNARSAIIATAAASPTCTTGEPVTAASGGWVVTFAAVTPIATAAATAELHASYAVDSSWAEKNLLSQRTPVSGTFLSGAYIEFKCQFECSGSPVDGLDACAAWFIGWDSNKQDWACTQYKALIPPAMMIKVPSSGNGSLLDGTAFNRICKK